MTHAAVAPFTAAVRPSWLWLGWVVLTHGALMTAVFCLLPPSYWLVLAGCPLTLWLALAPTGWLPGATFISRMQIDASGRLSAAFGTNEQLQPAEVLDDSFISNWLIVLNLRINGHRRSVPVLHDSAPDEFRRALRVYLRWYPLSPRPVKRRLIDFFGKNESTKHLA